MLNEQETVDELVGGFPRDELEEQLDDTFECSICGGKPERIADVSGHAFANGWYCRPCLERNVRRHYRAAYRFGSRLVKVRTTRTTDIRYGTNVRGVLGLAGGAHLHDQPPGAHDVFAAAIYEGVVEAAETTVEIAQLEGTR